MVTNSDLTKFAEIINECKELTSTVPITVGADLPYLFCQLYGKTLLTMSEIYILLASGYPEGAMALSRNTYETMVVMTYLYDRKDDQSLLERFLDDYSIKTCQDHIQYLKWIISNGRHVEEASERLYNREKEFASWVEKYSNFATYRKDTTFFKQYWWAGNISYSKLRSNAGYQHTYLYDISCYRVHASMAGSIRFDNREDGILIDACESR